MAIFLLLLACFAVTWALIGIYVATRSRKFIKVWFDWPLMVVLWPFSIEKGGRYYLLAFILTFVWIAVGAYLYILGSLFSYGDPLQLGDWLIVFLWPIFFVLAVIRKLFKL